MPFKKLKNIYNDIYNKRLIYQDSQRTVREIQLNRKMNNRCE